MDLTRGLEDLVAVALVAALAPLVAAVLPGPCIPQVVVFLIGGVLIGPIAARFGLDVVLGAVLAGMVLRGWTRHLRMDTESLEHKFDAVGYGIFIPIFFVSSGMSLDLKAISQDPLRLLLFFAPLLVVRGLPSLLIALATIGQEDGVMLPATAASMIGAGVLSVLVFPLIAVGLHKRAALTPADVGLTAEETPQA